MSFPVTGTKTISPVMLTAKKCLNQVAVFRAKKCISLSILQSEETGRETLMKQQSFPVLCKSITFVCTSRQVSNKTEVEGLEPPTLSGSCFRDSFLIRSDHFHSR